MEELLYVIGLVLWLVFSIYKKKSKSKQTAASGETSSYDTSTAPPVESEFEKMFEELFGEKKAARKMEESFTERASVDTYEEEHAFNEYEFASSASDEYASYMGADAVGTDYQFSHAALGEDSFKSEFGSHSITETEISDIKNSDLTFADHSILRDFDPIKAIVYSEILKRPAF